MGGVGLPNLDSAVPKGGDLGVRCPSVFVNWRLEPQSLHACVTDPAHDASLVFASVRLSTFDVCIASAGAKALAVKAGAQPELAPHV
jgi:hypothetical protein